MTKVTCRNSFLIRGGIGLKEVAYLFRFSSTRRRKELLLTLEPLGTRHSWATSSPWQKFPRTSVRPRESCKAIHWESKLARESNYSTAPYLQTIKLHNQTEETDADSPRYYLLSFISADEGKVKTGLTNDTYLTTSKCPTQKLCRNQE